ncbi:MAG: hypothetical protein COA58_09800 [Bacteroidetes bacterium]|nr:MAG: hypothetical protein COA58_09800 [Bacteroidota bacterium]
MSSCAQVQGWIKQFGGPSGEGVRSISIDNEGNTYLTGSFTDTVDFDLGAGIHNLSSSGHTGVYLLKLDNCGNFIWARNFGGSGINDGYSVSLDNSGNVYLLGNYQGTGDFDPGVGVHNLNSLGKNDFFIVKLDRDGTFIWVKSFGGVAQDIANQFIINDSTITVVGYFEETADFNPNSPLYTLTSDGSYDIFVMQLDLNGNFKWAKKMGGTSRAYGFSIATDSKGNYYTTGYFSGTADFDPGTANHLITSNGFDDIFISKLDSIGHFIWAKTIGGQNFERSYGVTIDLHDNIFLTGGFLDSIDSDPGVGVDFHYSNGGADVFITKLSYHGKHKWTRTFGSGAYDYGKYIDTDAYGNIYTSGYFQETVDFDPNILTHEKIAFGRRDAFISKIDSNGHLIWAENIGGKLNDYGGPIAIDPEGNIFWAGIFSDTLELSPNWHTNNKISSGSYDIFIIKLDQDTTTIDSITACKQYTSPSGNIWTTSDIYLDTLTNKYGCDSIISIVLTIKNIDTTISNNSGTLSSLQDSATYQWFDCSNNFAPITGEVNQEYTSTKNGIYAVEITSNGYIDTSACVLINTLKIKKGITESNAFIYPNPTSNFILIDLDGHYSNIKVKIFDVSGTLVIQNDYEAVETIQMSLDLQPGYYFIQLTSQNNKIRFKTLRCLKL